jgi:hypothetical protein
MVLFLKTLLIIPLFAFYICSIGLFFCAARDKNLPVRRLYNWAGWALIVGGILVDVAHLYLHHASLGESLNKIAMLCCGLGTGFAVSAETIKRASSQHGSR